ncbi:hypothetical protein GlitD10_0758 [Gloeomargarita lithophora Alchichica-D10]|uniref:DUF3592 domain-containing protein n=1 Tax=Gloeomargarita lithophora Alchichica-D10 TaxID=1188229 RepID=A0A1J0AAV9_9CYAN|nr:DUF3592 domain-containing protein [Gloeomargarita lithophora]APB33072.1 hypothetical protein GlitD10_0758 [Gloeomargarita lithophora Alchichica-D10]
MSNRQFFWIFGGIFAGIGSIFLALGFGFFQHTRSFLATAATTTGEVIALERRRSSNVYYPVVKFVGSDGEPVRFEGQVGSTPPAFRVGQMVEVLYNPAQPQSARIRSFMELWFGATIFAGIGGVFFLIGGVSLVSQFRPR